MCTQIAEILHFKGKQFEMEDLPVEQYFRKMPNPPQFEMLHTALYRGYVGTWKIHNKKLFLTKFEVTTKGELVDKMAKYFSKKTSVFAEWFSGKIMLGIGEPYMHGAAFVRANYKTYYILHFKKGVLERIFEEVGNGEVFLK